MKSWMNDVKRWLSMVWRCCQWDVNALSKSTTNFKLKHAHKMKLDMNVNGW